MSIIRDVLWDLVLKLKAKVEGDPRAKYWNKKWPINPITYKAQNELERDVRTLIPPKSYVIQRKAFKWLGNKSDDIAQGVLNWVIRNVKYKGDFETHQTAEYWQHPEETIQTKNGDCVAEYEELYTPKGLIQVKDLNVGDEVLSYDLDKAEYVTKKVIKIWDKGILPRKRVHLRNGQHIDITDNHPLWVRTNQQGKSKYEKRYLSDIDLIKWWKRKLPIATKIPYLEIDIPDLNEELCIVLGHFLAEGYIEGSHVRSCGYELIDHIIPLLEKNDIPFSEGKNNSGVPTINFLCGWFKDLLKEQKKDSFDIHLSERLFHLPSYKLEEILYGMWLGDGTKKKYPDKRGYANNKEWTYSTSSEQLSKDIQRIGLQLGRTFHIWKQENHQGIGNKPIWRINYNPNSHFLKDFGYEDVSEVSISWIEDLGEVKMRDFEVEDTHTFIFKNGIISHQCEDGALLIASMMRIAGVPAYRIKVCAGWVQDPRNKNNWCGHAYTIYLTDQGKWVCLDWCYWPDRTPMKDRKAHSELEKYKEIWFTFNDEFSWSQKSTKI